MQVISDKLVNPEARIETTNRCNAHCVFCPREKMTRPEADMPQQHFTRLVDELKSLGAKTISVFGYGEPLLDKDLHNKIEYCSRSGLNTFITTNGSLFDAATAVKLFDAGLTDLRFSIHGINNEQYNKVHRKLDGAQTTRHLVNAISIKNKMNYDCRIQVISMVNGDSVEAAKLHWSMFDLDSFEIWQPHNWAGKRNYRQTLRQKGTCGRPFTGPVQITSDGRMIVCCFDTDAEMVIGNTYYDSIEYILNNSELLKIIQQAHREENHVGLLCYSCDQLNEGDRPLLYSTRDDSDGIGKTSLIKFDLQGGT